MLAVQGTTLFGVSPARSSASELTRLERRAGRELAERRQVEPVVARPVGRRDDLAGARPQRDERTGRPDVGEQASASVCRSMSSESWRSCPASARSGTARARRPSASTASTEARECRAAGRRTSPAARRGRPRPRPGSAPGPPRSSRRSPRRPGRGWARRTRGSAPATGSRDRPARRDGLDGLQQPARHLVAAVDDRLDEGLRPGGVDLPSAYGAGSTPTSSASSRADAPAFASPSDGLSMPTRTTGRSVTIARPPAPRMSPRSAVTEDRSSTSPRPGSARRAGAQLTCHSSPLGERGRDVVLPGLVPPTSHVQRKVASATPSPSGSATSTTVTVLGRSPMPATTSS